MDKQRHPQVIRTWKVERLKKRIENDPPKPKSRGPRNRALRKAGK